MSTTRTDVDDVDRLGRVTLSRTIEPGDLRVTGLVSELGAGKALGRCRRRAASLQDCGVGRRVFREASDVLSQESSQPVLARAG